uniref:Dihydroxyacetone kinase n=1 Tax=Chaetoceros debilis TaxID=122233 RepID=A0A7S3QBP9_9STRA
MKMNAVINFIYLFLIAHQTAAFSSIKPPIAFHKNSALLAESTETETETEIEMVAPKKIINDPSDAVSEFISGLLYQYPNTMTKLQNHNVILSTTITHDKVNILSGGGSGHEPSHAGWVGSKGMLTGAILGGIFASPSVASIVAAIRAVTQVNAGKGCLLIVKNYTGDRLNFGMACEIANSEGRKCQMVVVADDAALERTNGITGARGVAGTVLVHKIAGAAAEKGLELEEVAAAAGDMANRVKSLGVALDSVTIPGASSVNDRLDEKTIEIGLGIHGEAGIQQSTLKTADELASIIVKTILDYGRDEDGKIVPTYKAGDDLALMVNNLGGISNFEMSILVRGVMKILEGGSEKCSVSRVYVGAFMTSFDMKGASVSIVSLTDAPDALIGYLDDETDASAWAKADIYKKSDGPRLSASEVPEVEAPKKEAADLSSVQVSIDDFESKVSKGVKAACDSLIENEPLLTKYDTIVGDGDCGITMMRGSQEIISRLQSGKLVTSHPVPFFDTLADAISASMGGTSGILLEIMFRKMSTFLNASDSATGIDGKKMVEAFFEGVNAVSFYGGATVGSRTMLDALFPAVDAMTKGEDGAKAAVDGAQSTADMGTASAGRSNYLNEDTLSGTPDPGAVAVGLVLTALYDSLK